MKKRILSLLLAFLMLFSMFPAYSTYAVETEKEVSVWYFNSVSEAMEEADAVELYRGGELYLSAILRDDISGDIQWQIEANQDFWVDIQGGTAEDLRVSYGMVQSLLKDDTVRMRCIVSDNEEYCSDPFTVMVTDVDNRLAASSYVLDRTPIAPDPLPAPVGVPNETEPIADDEAEPEVAEETEPAATEETEPAATEETEPVATEETEPAATEETEPAATEGTEPAATEETEPASTEETEPAATEETEPVVTEETEPVTAEETEPVVTEETEPVATEETEPVVTEETEPVVTEETVSIVENAVPLASASTPRIMLLSAVNTTSTGTQNEDVTYYTVTIEYVYGNSSNFAGQRVALPYIAEVAAGDTLSETVTSPSCVGYLPNISSINLAELGEITGNISRTVVYSPAEVSYTVRHYLQNVDDDEYTWVDTTMTTGYTEALTSDKAAKTYTGFTALSHYNEEIAADSSTMIDIYYDRNYYLMSFNLDGGYGVEAVYARFGADISVSDPQKAGYSFTAWSPAIPTTMPAGNSSYTALWTAGNTSYTVAYWLENANTDNQYDFAGSVSANANSGDSVSGSDSAVANSVFTADERQYFAYNADKTNVDVTVAGDGNTVVNVYYDRNEYTLKFYYARLEGTTYDIADNTNGSSNNGGTAASASWVGNFTVKPTLDSKYTEQTEVLNGNTYYFFTITAKYGASLSEIWPNAPLTAAGNYDFISWGTHYGSGYYTSNSNKNIKGVYSVMDSGLLIDPTVTAEKGVNHWMVGYWNTAPTMYTYEIYYSLLAGETADRTYSGVGYKKVTQYTVGSTDVPSGQTALSFEGVSPVGKDYDSNTKVDGAIIRFYYQRTQNTVTLDDNYGNSITRAIPYGGTISSYITTVPTPNYPADLPVGAYEFAGWYQSKEGIGALDTGITMPNEDLIYYALWTPKVYTVTINDGNGTVFTEQVNYGSKATKPTDPTMENATFIGWYYKDADKSEQRFDFDNMTITQDMTIYAKWRSEVMKQVEIYYVVEDEDGNKTQIADTETLMLRLGQTRTFEAKTGSSLYAEYRTGCFPTTVSHSITIEDSHIESTEPVTFTFEYKKYGAVPYQVEFYVLDENDVARPAFKENAEGKAEFVEYGQWSNDYAAYIEQHWQNDKAVVTELYVPDDLAVSTWTLPDEYLPNALKIQKIIVPSETDPTTNIEANIIKFVYTHTEPVVDPDNPDNPDPGTPVYEARYLVQHFIQNSSDTTKYDLYSYSDEEGLSGETATASAISIPGYTFSPDVTNENKQNGTTLGTDNAMSGKITADDKLELNFYYTVNSYPYQVMYLEEGTNRVLADAKTEVDGKQLIGLYGSKVTEEAISIDGYDVVGSSSKSIYIQMEAGNTASVNTIVFYYKLKSAELILSKEVKLDEEQAAQEGISEIPSWVYNQEFVFTVYQPEGYPKSVYHYTFTSTDGSTEDKTVNAGVQTIVVSLKHGESIRFHDFPMGTYTVTETYVPGFRTSVDGYIAQAHTVTLDTDGDVGTLHFLNTFPFYTGDLVIKKNVTKLDERDPSATEPYKVTVVLNPDDSSREVDRVITFVDKDGNALTDASNNTSFTIPKLTGTDDQTQFTITLLVPVGGEVKLEGVPVGSFTAEEEVKGTIGYIYDFYTVKYNKAVHENDEVTGTNHVVSGSIHGGHPTAVTFNNTYKKGGLTINKTVTQEYEKDNWQSDTFTFSITGTTELPDGIYVVDGATVTVSNGVVIVKDSNGNDPAISITKTDGATSWSGSLTFENLPAGYYTVRETAGLGNDNYTAVGPNDSLLVNDTSTAAEANFANTYKRTTGNLQVGKKIVIVTAGSIIDAKQEFTFVVEPKDGTLTGSYYCTVKTTNGTTYIADDTIVENGATSLPVNDGKLTFKLKHNQYILIEGLPVGEYLVKEEAVEGYDSSFGDVITNAGNYSDDPATITTNNTTVLNCQNAYPVYYSNLIVKKSVVTPADHSAVDQAPADDEFTFTVTISGYSNKVDLTKGVTAKFYDSTDTLIKTEAILLNANSLTFTLKAGEWVDLNLPACTYTIAETGLSSTVNSDVLADHYETTYTVGGEVGVAGESYTLVSGEQETVVFTNTYKRHYLDLTITTNCADYNQSFIFDVSATGTALGDIHLTVVLVGNDSQTIKDLPVGDYTVTEQTEWSWREAYVTSKTVELRTKSVTVSFDFGVIDRIYWLNGYSYNIRKKGDD